MVSKRQWRCPGCNFVFEVPDQDADPELCENCARTADPKRRVRQARQQFAEEQSANKPSSRWRRWLGVILLAFGALGVIRYLTMDTSVEVGFTGKRVHNIGLMQKQQNGVIVSLGVSAIGVVILLADRRPK